MQFRIEPGFSCHILKASVSHVVIERHTRIRAVVSEKNILLAVSIVIKKTSSWSQYRSDEEPLRLVFRYAGVSTNPRFLRHVHKPHLDLRRRPQHRRRRLYGPRVLSLLAISQAYRRANFVLRDVLEFFQVLASVVGVGRLLVSA